MKFFQSLFPAGMSILAAGAIVLLLHDKGTLSHDIAIIVSSFAAIMIAVSGISRIE